jgi:hypothetical protein
VLRIAAHNLACAHGTAEDGTAFTY